MEVECNEFLKLFPYLNRKITEGGRIKYFLLFYILLYILYKNSEILIKEKKKDIR